MRSLYGLLLAAFIFLSLVACKSKKKTADPRFFPVLSYLKSQVAQVDTSLNTIRKYVFTDSAHTDTIYIPREQFRATAADFLAIPDLSTADYADRFTYSEQFDETLNRVLIVNTAINPEKEILQRQEVLIKPDPSGDKVTNIIINTQFNSKDSSIEKKMLWKVDQSFTVTTIKQVKGQPEMTTTYKVAWNEDE